MTADGGVLVAAKVPPDLAANVRDMARDAERSVAAEIRLALRAWVDQAAESRKVEGQAA